MRSMLNFRGVFYCWFYTPDNWHGSKKYSWRFGRCVSLTFQAGDGNRLFQKATGFRVDSTVPGLEVHRSKSFGFCTFGKATIVTLNQIKPPWKTAVKFEFDFFLRKWEKIQYVPKGWVESRNENILRKGWKIRMETSHVAFSTHGSFNSAGSRWVKLWKDGIRRAKCLASDGWMEYKWTR